MSSFSSISSFSSSSALYRRSHELLALVSSLLTSENQTIQLRTDLANYIAETILKLQKFLTRKYEDRVDCILKELLKKLSEVKGMSVYAPPGPTQHPFVISYYNKLEELWLYQCPPSTILGLFRLRKHLIRLTVEYSGICDMSDVLTPVRASLLNSLQPMILPDQPVSLPAKYHWSNLLSLRLSHCGIVRIDESLHFFPQLVSLDLSHNHIMHIVHLQDCIALQHLDLSHNRIRVLSNLERVLGKVKRLDLSYNEIESLDGLDKLYSLESVFLAGNYLSDLHEVCHIARLPCLEQVVLAKNPIAEGLHYRLKVFAVFIQVGSLLSSDRSPPLLDKQGLSAGERRQLRRIMFSPPSNKEGESTYLDLSPSSSPFNWEVLVGEEEEGLGGEGPEGGEGGGEEDRGSIGGEIRGDYTPVRRESRVGKRGERSLSSSRLSRYSLSSSRGAKRLSVESRLSRFSLYDTPPQGGKGMRKTDAYGNNFHKELRNLRERGQVSLSSSPLRRRRGRRVEIVEREGAGEGRGGEERGGMSLGEIERIVEERVSLYGPYFLLNPQGAMRGEKGEEAAPLAPAPPTPPFTPSACPAPPSPLPSPSPRMDTFMGRIHEGKAFAPLGEEGGGEGGAGGEGGKGGRGYEEEEAEPSALSAPLSSIRESFSETIRITITKSGTEGGLTGGLLRGTGREERELSPVPPFSPSSSPLYRGDEQYGGLSVRDNLELYFREQVFSPPGSFLSPPIYLSPLEEGGEFVPPYEREEKFLSLYVERVVELEGGGSSEGDLLHLLPSPQSLEEQGGERSVIVALSDQALYFVEGGRLTGRETFLDAPLLSVLRSHPLSALRGVTIYFGFQRFSLLFQPLSPSSLSSFSPPALSSQYLFLPRDKARTYPLVTKIPQVANQQRQVNASILHLPKVQIQNLDSELLEQTLAYTQSLGSNRDDIVYYQMCFQIARPAGSVEGKLPCSLILTQSLILLCGENLRTLHVELKVLEYYSLKDVQQVFVEENALFVTFVFRRSNMLSRRKRWRFCLDGRNASNRLVEETKRACAEVGNEGV